MQWVSSRIWTRVAVFISYDDNNYTTGYFHLDIRCIHYNSMYDFLNRSDVFEHRILYNYSYDFIKISLLIFLFWNYIIYLYILSFHWWNVLWSFKIRSYFTFRLFLNIVLIFMLATVYVYTNLPAQGVMAKLQDWSSEVSKVREHCRGWPEGSLFDSYYTKL